MRYSKNKFRVLFLILAITSLVGASYCFAANQGFVGRVGTHFALNGGTYYFSAANEYYLWYKIDAAGGDTLIADQILQDAINLKMNVLRLFAFCDGSEYAKQYNGKTFCFQPNPGDFSNQMSLNAFNNLDYIIWKADQLNIRLIVSLVNNWQDFGGMDKYVQWATGQAPPSDMGSTEYKQYHAQFYTNATCKQYYKAYVNQFLNHVNSYTGRAYKNEPTIMILELTNEGRCDADPSGATFQSWIEEMSDYVKSIDFNHMVSTGGEGWFGASGIGDEQTKLLLHYDGNFIDSSQYAHVVTAFGNAHTELPTVPKFDQAVLFDGDGDYLTIPDSSDFNFGSEDFTIDFWLKFNSPINEAGFYHQMTNSDSDILFFWVNNNLRLQVTSGGQMLLSISNAWVPIADTWYHVVLVRAENHFKMFINGNQLGADYVSSVAIPDYAGSLNIGRRSFASDYQLNGMIDEYRISKGIARWTGNFTPPTQPHSAFSFNSGSHGVDFLGNSSYQNIDVCTFHLYQDRYAYSDSQAADWWIGSHISMAQNTIGKPIYMGEFGWPVHRGALNIQNDLLYDFDNSTESWGNYNDNDYRVNLPIQVENPSYNSNGSLYFSLIDPLPSGVDCLGGIKYESGTDLSQYDNLVAWVYVPASADPWLRAQLVVKSGSSWKWTESKYFALIPGEWVRLDISKDTINAGGLGNIADVKYIGVRVHGGNVEYNDGFYVDCVQGVVGDVENEDIQMVKRNNHFSTWYNMVDFLNADGAALWRLADSSHEPPEDRDDYEVYPEDTETRNIIYAFSELMEEKTGNFPGASLDARLYNVSNDQPAANQRIVNFPEVTGQEIYPRVASALQYVKITYENSFTEYGISISTNNLANTPHYVPPPDDVNCDWGAGLVGHTPWGAGNSTWVVPLLWTVFPDIENHGIGYIFTAAKNQQGWYTVEAGVMDKMNESEYTYEGTRMLSSDTGGGLDWLANYPNDGAHVNRRIASTFYIYLGADFNGKPADTYSTNTLTIELWHK